jgi:hypothetical protein
MSENRCSSEWLRVLMPEYETDTPVMFSNVKTRLLLLSPEGWRTCIFLELEWENSLSYILHDAAVT